MASVHFVHSVCAEEKRGTATESLEMYTILPETCLLLRAAKSTPIMEKRVVDLHGHPPLPQQEKAHRNSETAYSYNDNKKAANFRHNSEVMVVSDSSEKKQSLSNHII